MTEAPEIIQNNIDVLARLYGLPENDEGMVGIDLQAMLIDVIGLAKLSILQGNGQTKEDFVAWVKEIWDGVEVEQVKERMQ